MRRCRSTPVEYGCALAGNQSTNPRPRPRLNPLVPLIYAFVILWGLADAQAQLRVTAIDWVQGRAEIPHPALNGKSTILQAIAEGGNCGGNYSYRWDWNGDGDFNDRDEGWHQTSSGGHRGGYFASLGLEVQFPDQPGDRLLGGTPLKLRLSEPEAS